MKTMLPSDHQKPVEVPTLDRLVADPALAWDLPVPVLQQLLIQVTSLCPVLVAALQTRPTTAPSEDRLLAVEEAAAILGITIDHLYRHSDDYPFTIRAGRSLRFSSNGIQKYIRTRLHKV